MSDLVTAVAAWLGASLPLVVVLIVTLRCLADRDERAAETLADARADWAVERAQAAAERDHLVRTVIATSGGGAAAMALRTTRPELGDVPSGRERLLAEARAAALAQAREDRGELSPGAMIPVGMGGE